MPFKPGQSGNPSGRPRVDKNVVELARQHTKEAVKTLATLMRKSENEAVRASAAQALLDRGWGRPMQSMALGVGGIDPAREAEIQRVINEVKGMTFYRPEFVRNEPRRIIEAEVVNDPG